MGAAQVRIETLPSSGAFRKNPAHQVHVPDKLRLRFDKKLSGVENRSLRLKLPGMKGKLIFMNSSGYRKAIVIINNQKYVSILSSNELMITDMIFKELL